MNDSFISIMISDAIKNDSHHTKQGQAGMELTFLIAARMVCAWSSVDDTWVFQVFRLLVNPPCTASELSHFFPRGWARG